MYRCPMSLDFATAPAETWAEDLKSPRHCQSTYERRNEKCVSASMVTRALINITDTVPSHKSSQHTRHRSATCREQGEGHSKLTRGMCGSNLCVANPCTSSSRVILTRLGFACMCGNHKSRWGSITDVRVGEFVEIMIGHLVAFDGFSKLRVLRGEIMDGRMTDRGVNM